MKVVALVPGGIGDQILFFPTLDRLKQSYPEAEIDAIVEPRSKGAYRVNQSVRRVIPFDFKDRNSPADWGNLLGILRDREYEVAISLGQRWAVGLLLWLTGIPTRISYEGPGSMFLTHPIPLKTEQYAVHMYYDLLAGLKIPDPCPDLSIAIPKKDLEWAESEQAKLGLTDTGYVLIHGGSSQLAKTKGIDKIYPVERWQAIAKQLQEKQPDLPLVVLKGPEDEAFVEQLLQVCPSLKVTSPPDIGKLAATIAGANLMLCTDSAPMHLSVAVKTFTIALFGPTNPQKLLPVSDKFIGIASPTGKMADIPAQAIVDRILG
ncbi:glycosyltransferase family 9 protein [Roseofilum casamattae]|uniref:Glycosyltransferase family 9 protein n=1 Tax=Roseofilum casamattae BLCC-M143 TaxID=3022442 RepID=A0ABT7BU65_9CYAN|nr:glycosyltransferase family 9 protein [Roseofilum casamattae]MDJ1182726.1 glycosyltransferase family 9 protein [Roseofilum casamattae BLCC-M143]